ncbi:MAG: hypothetical protein WCC57_07785 [Paracoccaceae bacterium]
MPQLPDVPGTAALTICESLLLALRERKILPENEISGILHDAAEAHANHPAEDDKAGFHQAVAALINSMIVGENSVRTR